MDAIFFIEIRQDEKLVLEGGLVTFRVFNPEGEILSLRPNKNLS